MQLMACGEVRFILADEEQLEQLTYLDNLREVIVLSDSDSDPSNPSDCAVQNKESVEDTCVALNARLEPVDLEHEKQLRDSLFQEFDNLAVDREGEPRCERGAAINRRMIFMRLL